MKPCAGSLVACMNSVLCLRPERPSAIRQRLLPVLHLLALLAIGLLPLALLAKGLAAAGIALLYGASLWCADPVTMAYLEMENGEWELQLASGQWMAGRLLCSWRCHAVLVLAFELSDGRRVNWCLPRDSLTPAVNSRLRAMLGQG